MRELVDQICVENCRDAYRPVDRRGCNLYRKRLRPERFMRIPNSQCSRYKKVCLPMPASVRLVYSAHLLQCEVSPDTSKLRKLFHLTLNGLRL